MGLFDGGSEAAGQAQSAYSNEIQKAIDAYQKFWQQGRGDVLGMYGQGLGFLNPYMQRGAQAENQLAASMGLGGGQPGVAGAPQGAGEAQQSAVNKFQASPGYQFALQQGLQGIQQNAAARGLLGSTGTARQMQNYAQQMANQEYGQYQNRLGALAQGGQQAAGQAFQGALGTGQYLGGLGAQYAGDIGGAYGALGQGAANAIMGGYASDAQKLAAFEKMLGEAAGAFAAK